jgi:hypothetical protein
VDLARVCAIGVPSLRLVGVDDYSVWVFGVQLEIVRILDRTGVLKPLLLSLLDGPIDLIVVPDDVFCRETIEVFPAQALHAKSVRSMRRRLPRPSGQRY